MVIRSFSLAGAFALALIVQDASAQPSTQAAGATTRHARPFYDRRDGQSPRIRREQLGTYDPSNVGGPLSSQEKEEVRSFMQRYSPERLRRLEDVPDQRQTGIYKRIAAQYRSIERMKEEDPEIYQLRLKRLPIEDAMFSLGWQLKRSDDATTKVSTEELRSKLREQVRLFVDSHLEERRIRIERNVQRIKKEQADLQEAQEKLRQMLADKDALIEKGVTGIENERGDALKELSAPILRHPNLPRGAAASEPSAGVAPNDTPGQD